MDILSNELLIEAYYKAIELKLPEDFQAMLKEELKRRNIQLNE